MPKKKSSATKSVKSKPQTKTAFVLAHPHSTPAKEVVAKGKAAGVALTDKLVWAIRSDAKAKGKRGSKPGKSATSHRGSLAAPRAGRITTKAAEDALRAAAHVLGLARASEILDAEQRRAHDLLA